MKEIKKQENLVYSGKSKEVYEILDGAYAGKYRFVFTDRATGYIDDKGNFNPDPGSDKVRGVISGKGEIACQIATYFFELLKNKGIPSHYIKTINKNEMVVEPAILFSMPAQAPKINGSAPLQNLEWVWRHNAAGSYCRRYPFVKPGKYLGENKKDLDFLVEVTTKGEKDIPIDKDSLTAAGVMTRQDVSDAVKLVKNIAKTVYNEFQSKGLHAIDGKFELGRLKKDGKIVLIDEISPDVLRVCSGYVPEENRDCRVYRECIDKMGEKGKNMLTPDEIIKIFLDNNKV